MSMERYEQLAAAFVGLADTLIADYDAVELAHQLIDSAVTLLPIAAAGILLGDTNGELHLFAASSEQAKDLERLQMEVGAGPCLDAYRTGRPVPVDDLERGAAEWPAFAAQAGRCGFRAVTALPMRLREERVGGLNLFLAEPGPMTSADVKVGQALADVAAIGILHQRVLSQSEQVNQQLQTALTTRLIIEQAKGVLAERGGIDTNEAFNLLRAQARRTNRRLADLAHAVVDGKETINVLDVKQAM
jgi:GAF domain-containing protein